MTTLSITDRMIRTRMKIATAKQDAWKVSNIVRVIHGSHMQSFDYEMIATFVKLLRDKKLINDANKHEIDSLIN